MSSYITSSDAKNTIQKIQHVTGLIQEKKKQGDALLAKYEKHKSLLVGMMDLTIGKIPSQNSIQRAAEKVSTLANNIKATNDHIGSLLNEVDNHTSKIANAANVKDVVVKWALDNHSNLVKTL